MVTHNHAKAFAGTRGGGGGDDILKNVFGFLYTSLKHLISKTDFTVIKYSGQGSFKVKKGTIDKLLILLKTIGIYP